MSKKDLSSFAPKVAIVYDRVNTPYGGAENVLVALHHIFPDAPLYTAVYDEQRAHWARPFQVIPSFLQSLPFAKKFHRLFAWSMPLAFESFQLDTFDIVISVTSAEAKGILTKPDQLHVCYLLTPTRYLWSHRQEYQSHWLTGWFRKKVFQYLKWWDEVASWRPDVMIPISAAVAERCRVFYHRVPDPVIYPPVEVCGDSKLIADSKLPKDTPSSFYLVVSRLVPYKRIDLAIEACCQTGKNLIIVGEGPDLSRLETVAQQAKQRFQSSSQILFQPSVQPEQCSAYYLRCTAFLAPGEEDFGITVLEANAVGKPVIVNARSGAAELVEDGISGVYLQEQSSTAIVHAIEKIESISWNTERIQKKVQPYTTHHFEDHFKKRIAELWSQWKGKI